MIYIGADTKDIIDIREVQEAIDDARDVIQSYDDKDDVLPADKDRLQYLLDLQSQLNGVKEGPLIADSYFEEYARELAKKLNVIPETYTWPISCIDWERAVQELKMNYASVEFDCTTYWYRSWQ